MDQDKNFPISQSYIYKGNNGRLNVCYDCLSNLLVQYTNKLGSEAEAMKRIACHFDMYVTDGLINTMEKSIKQSSKLKNYIRTCNMVAYQNKTYDTFLDNQIKEEKMTTTNSNSAGITVEQIERWGKNIYTADEIEILDQHYNMLVKQNPNIDSNQEIFIKDLCNINLLKTQAIKEGDINATIKCAKEYRDTFNQAGLKTVVETDNSKNETICVTLDTISHYTPTEYYKNQKLYKDFDKLGENLSRHILRPLKNLAFGTNDRDKEFYVKDKDEDLT